jgi:hypothetical protein
MPQQVDCEAAVIYREQGVGSGARYSSLDAVAAYAGFGVGCGRPAARLPALRLAEQQPRARSPAEPEPTAPGSALDATVRLP